MNYCSQSLKPYFTEVNKIQSFYFNKSLSLQLKCQILIFKYSMKTTSQCNEKEMKALNHQKLLPPMENTQSNEDNYIQYRFDKLNLEPSFITTKQKKQIFCQRMEVSYPEQLPQELFSLWMNQRQRQVDIKIQRIIQATKELQQQMIRKEALEREKQQIENQKQKMKQMKNAEKKKAEQKKHQKDKSWLSTFTDYLFSITKKQSAQIEVFECEEQSLTSSSIDHFECIKTQPLPSKLNKQSTTPSNSTSNITQLSREKSTNKKSN